MISRLLLLAAVASAELPKAYNWNRSDVFWWHNFWHRYIGGMVTSLAQIWRCLRLCPSLVLSMFKGKYRYGHMVNHSSSVTGMAVWMWSQTPRTTFIWLTMGWCYMVDNGFVLPQWSWTERWGLPIGEEIDENMKTIINGVSLDVRMKS